MRIVVAALLLALAACGQAQAPAPPDGAAAPEGEGPVILDTTRSMPDWLLVARQRDCPRDAPPEDQCPLGEVHFNQRTITRDAANGTADIWIQVSHGQPQLFEMESTTTETTIRFELERLHYRFNCATSEFIVVERQILGPNEAVVARDEPRQIYRAPVRGSVTGIIMPIACRAT
jgi:hypothetical protein